MAIITRFTGGDAHEKSAMLVRETFEAVAVGDNVNTGRNSSDLYSDCPILMPVFGDLDDQANKYKNDFLGIFQQLKRLTTTATFHLLDEECNVLAELNDSTYGTYYPVGSFINSNASVGYRLDWVKVLAAFGAGVYKIRKTISSSVFAASDAESCSCNFNLMHYTAEDADNTVRMEFTYNSYYINSEEDFRGENWTSMFRVFGEFGSPNPVIERNSYLNTNRQIVDNQDKMYNEYTFETEFVPHCVSELLIPTQNNKSLASISDSILITDYNLTNHFSYIELPVFITKIKVNENSSSTRVNYELSCEDVNRKNVKRKVR